MRVSFAWHIICLLFDCFFKVQTSNSIGLFYFVVVVVFLLLLFFFLGMRMWKIAAGRRKCSSKWMTPFSSSCTCLLKVCECLNMSHMIRFICFLICSFFFSVDIFGVCASEGTCLAPKMLFQMADSVLPLAALRTFLYSDSVISRNLEEEEEEERHTLKHAQSQKNEDIIKRNEVIK